MDFLPLKKDGINVYSGFLNRLIAGIVDGIVLVPLFFLFQYIDGLSIPLAVVSILVSNLLFSAYWVFFHYRYGATLGKMFLKIKVTKPNGSSISLKQAVLRSSVDMFFTVLIITAGIMALSQVNPADYLSAGWSDRVESLAILYPSWFGVVTFASNAWYWSEFLTVLFNKRKRAIHDFIAGTVVINRQFAMQDDQENITLVKHQM